MVKADEELISYLLYFFKGNFCPCCDVVTQVSCSHSNKLFKHSSKGNFVLSILALKNRRRVRNVYTAVHFMYIRRAHRGITVDIILTYASIHSLPCPCSVQILLKFSVLLKCLALN